MGYKKTTIGLPENLLLRLQIFAKLQQKKQQDIVAEALNQFLPETLALPDKEEKQHAA